MKPTVGRVVHFYSDHLPDQGFGAGGFNDQGKGPYAAVVTQVFNNDDGSVSYANLKVSPPFSAPFDEGSVPEKGSTYDTTGSRYWEWPPREE